MRPSTGGSAPQIFTKEFVASPQNFLASTVLTTAHPFGVMPKLVQLSLRNLVGEGGYTLGDEVIIYGTVSESTAAGRAITLSMDPTNIVVAIGVTISILNRSTAANLAIVLANWQLVIRAWA